MFVLNPAERNARQSIHSREDVALRAGLLPSSDPTRKAAPESNHGFLDQEIGGNQEREEATFV